MTTSTSKASYDTFIDESRPSTNYGSWGDLRLSAGTSARRFGFVYFTGVPPAGATVFSATLSVFIRDGSQWTGGDRIITARRVNTSWSESKLTWNSSGATQAGSTVDPASVTVSGPATHQQVDIDVTAIMSDIAAGSPWYGLRLEVDGSGGTIRTLCATETTAGPAFKPVLTVEWSRPPDAPTSLAPSGGQSVSLAKPVLTWKYKDKDGDAQAAYQVQTCLDNTFAVSELDTGWVSDGDSQLNLATVATTPANFLTGDNASFTASKGNWSSVNGITLGWASGLGHTANGALQMTSTVNGTMSTGHCSAGNIATQGMPVSPGDSITITGWFKTAVTARSVAMGAQFYDSSGTNLGSPTYGSTVTDATGSWTQATTTLTVPATAAFCRATAEVTSAVIGEVHDLDDVSLVNNSSAYAGLTDGDTRFWRVRVQDANGLQSSWSGVASFRRDIRGALVISNPPDSGFVEETTPPITTTLTGRAQVAIAYTLSVDNGDGTWSQLWTTGRFAAAAADGDAFTFDIPKGYLKKNGTNYRLDVWSYDAIDRVATPGDNIGTKASATFTFAKSSVPSAPTSLAVTAAGAGVQVAFQRSTEPDYFALSVDGDLVYDRIDPASMLVGTGAYAFLYYGSTPNASHTFEVQAVVNDAGVLKHSQTNPTVTVKPYVQGIWLVDEGGAPYALDSSVRIARIDGQESQDMTIGESSNTYYPIGRRDPVTVTDAIRGLEGTITGTITDDSNGYLRDFRSMKHPDHVGFTYRLIYGTTSIPVQLGAAHVTPEPYATENTFAVSVDVVQVGDF